MMQLPLPASHRVLPLVLALGATGSALAQSEAFIGPRIESRPTVLEVGYAPVKVPGPNGGKSALLSATWMVAVDDDWGFGPTVLGTAKGDFGGVFILGATAQRRWRLGRDLHLAASMTVGGGGGRRLPLGGGLMLRPEVQVRQSFGSWYLGAGVAHTRFPNGELRDTGWSLTLGRAADFQAFSPRSDGQRASTDTPMGMGFDEMALAASRFQPSRKAKGRDGRALSPSLNRAGVDLRSYRNEGSWWGLEAAGAARGGEDGYIETLGNAGWDWPLLHPRLRAGVQLGVGLGGGGNIDTGNGWLLRGGATLRWLSPWGASLRLDANRTHAPSGNFSARETRLSLVLPLTGERRPDSTGFALLEEGVVRTQTLWGGVQTLPRVRLGNGQQGRMSQVVLGLNRNWSKHLYGTAQASSAAVGQAAGHAVGLVGLGAQTQPWAGRWRAGAELLAGVAGGGGVTVDGRAVGQAQLWLQTEGLADHERLVVRAALGQRFALRGSQGDSPVFSLSLGYAYGGLGR